MVTKYSLPEIKITVTHNSDTYQLEDYHTITDVLLPENAVTQAIIRASDYKGETFLNKVDVGDNIKIETRMADADGTWVQRFGGWAHDLTPTLDPNEGEIVTVNARGYGSALLAMAVAQEYGSQCSHPTLNTIKEVLTDATYGIIPKYTEKVLATATSSGYTVNTTKVADVTSSFRYLYWPYTPPKKCLDDMLDLISAANMPSAGAHWIVKPSGTTAYLCLATVGNHENPPADIWPTWWNTDQTGSTIEVKEDMLVSRFVKQRSEANYVVYAGKLRKPAVGDKWWTEYKGSGSDSGKDLWGVGASNPTLTNDLSFVKVNSYSIKATLTAGGVNQEFSIYYPSAANLGWDVTKWGGKYNIPTISFFFARDADAMTDTDARTGVGFATNSGDSYAYYFGTKIPSADTWYQFTVPFGPYYRFYEHTKEEDFSWVQYGSGNWANINSIYFFATAPASTEADFWVDGLELNGWIVRGARDDTKIGTQKCCFKILTDDIGKDDTGKSGTPGTTDVGTMAQLAKAELYRAIQTPITGVIEIPGQPTIWPGQLCHIHYGLKADGNYNINTNMRLTQVHDRFAAPPNGYRNYLSLTNDVLNSQARGPVKGYSLLRKAVNPNYQTREMSSIKAKDIDITQELLSENYST